jgi:4-hydroxy-4-methyl-2-oxoglutarate aldolase
VAVNEVSAALVGFDTCVVSDALDRLGLFGVLTGLEPKTVSRRFAGRAVTVQLGMPGPDVPASRHLATAALEASRPGDVIVVANGRRLDCAAWGGLLSQAAVRHGVSGVVVDGALRDVDEAAQLGLPVHARGVTPRTARGRAVEVAWGKPVMIGTCRVATGDWILADGSGVLVVPVEQLDEVVRVARELAAREQAMGAAIRAGRPVSAVMGGAYETLLSSPAAERQR